MRSAEKTSELRWAGLALALALVSCSGSSSETPWPAEPIDLEPGPAGEGRQGDNVVDTSKLPDNYTKRGEGGAGATGDPEDESVDPEDAPWGPEAPPEKEE